ncbi:MAG: HIT domain-containing protein [Ignavibacteriales bacterium]|nr:HIT domain-containing protein [Ignavibacteriales bacterium]
MKRLFSPWRSAYIASFRGTKKSKGCLFCRIAKENQDKKNLVVWRGEHCFLVMNLYPYNSGHLMVVPYKHTANLAALTKETYVEIMETTLRGMKALGKTSGPHGFNLGANIGRIAGAGIDKHIHFHIVPRWSGDTNFMPVLTDVKLISEDLANTWARLRTAMNRKGKN